MHISAVVVLSALGLAGCSPLTDRMRPCIYEIRRQGVAQEIKTIGSHSATDAAAIPLAPISSRTFYITPTDIDSNLTLPPVNVGVTAETIRKELVLLATVLGAGVPPDSVQYTDNANGSVTVDFIQTDRIVLPSSHVREIHEFDQNCQIKKITGYVHGPVICPDASIPGWADVSMIEKNVVVPQVMATGRVPVLGLLTFLILKRSCLTYRIWGSEEKVSSLFCELSIIVPWISPRRVGPVASSRSATGRCRKLPLCNGRFGVRGCSFCLARTSWSPDNVEASSVENGTVEVSYESARSIHPFESIKTK